MSYPPAPQPMTGPPQPMTGPPGYGYPMVPPVGQPPLLPMMPPAMPVPGRIVWCALIGIHSGMQPAIASKCTVLCLCRYAHANT